MIRIICILLIVFTLSVDASLSEQDVSEKLHNIQEKITSADLTIAKKIDIVNALIIKAKTRKTAENEQFAIYIQTQLQKQLDSFRVGESTSSALTETINTGVISDYKIEKKEFQVQDISYITLRSFTQNNTGKFLILNLQDYKTSVVHSENIKNIQDYGDLYNASKYKTVQDTLYSNANDSLQNNGLKSAIQKKDNHVYLTADLCPSSKHGFEKQVFQDFISQGHTRIALAITSTWITGHPDEYETLKNWNNSGELDVTWVNHTKTHAYRFGKSFSKNFILTPGLELHDEIIDVEKRLLSSGQVPSVFMRFPGLVSDDETRKQVIYKYGLIPLGSDAWLAKGENPESGSIILIHGNKNEPAGIKIMRSLLKNKDFDYGDIRDVIK